MNNIQIDGISFIEHISFDAFNEGIRLKKCIFLHQRLLKRRVRAVAADAIYTANDNRRFCTRNNICTSFVRKEKPAKNETHRKILRSELSRERTTRLEGSFGTQKSHYILPKVRTRKQAAEVLWIFFGIHTANAVKMIEKIEKYRFKEAA